ncbi:hypothetical protein [Aeromonas popoffii]|uniref:hypothetical protein n=1 Tax=Aeromonas popoffii TaxID=70856 RepID=UPI0012ED74BB|nr:hypothetical protein [Aeromonas popoffii]
MLYKACIISTLLIGSYVHAATDYSTATSNCIAWSKDVINGEFSYSFSPAIPYGGGIQVSFISHSLKDISQEHIDTVFESKVNGRTISFAAQGYGSSIIFRPQNKNDTKFILDAATTGSLTFNDMVFKTGGTKTVVNYMLSQCKD